MCVVSGFLLQWRSEGRAWPGTNPPKVRPAHVRASASVVSAMVKRTTGAWPIPMTWLRHCSLSPGSVCLWCIYLWANEMAWTKWPAIYTQYFALGMQLPPALQSPFSFHFGCAYALKKKKKLSRSISLSSKFDHIRGAARPHLN